MKLHSMVDFVLNLKLDYGTVFSETVFDYAVLLKKPLELWMFVPCDDNGNVLEKPNKNSSIYDEFINHFEHGFNEGLFEIDLKKYQQAKERCLFDGFENGFRIPEQKVFSVNNRIFDENETIENLLQYKGMDFTLTETAIKQTQ